MRCRHSGEDRLPSSRLSVRPRKRPMSDSRQTGRQTAAVEGMDYSSFRDENLRKFSIRLPLWPRMDGRGREHGNDQNANEKKNMSNMNHDSCHELLNVKHKTAHARLHRAKYRDRPRLRPESVEAGMPTIDVGASEQGSRRSITWADSR